MSGDVLDVRLDDNRDQKERKKVVLLTGSSSGIGYETAMRLLERGYTVYAAARRQERMFGLRDKGARLLQMDLTKDWTMVAAVNRIIKEAGHIDVLINNAGYGAYGALETVPMDEARHQMEVNVIGMARMTQLVLPHMRKQGEGRIVNVASIAGHFGEPRGGWYHATKHAVVGLTDSLRMELRKMNIAVVLIEPGLIESEWSLIAMQHLQERSRGTVYEKRARRQARRFKRLYAHWASSPEKVARAIEDAVMSGRPRVRYRMGRGSRLIPLMHRLLPTRAFDRWVCRVLG